MKNKNENLKSILKVIAPISFSDGVYRTILPFIAAHFRPDPYFIALTISVSKIPWLLSFAIGSWSDKKNPIDNLNLILRAKLVAAISLAFLHQNASESNSFYFLITIFAISLCEVFTEILTQKIASKTLTTNFIKTGISKIILLQSFFGLFLAPILSSNTLTKFNYATIYSVPFFIFIGLMELNKIKTGLEIKNDRESNNETMANTWHFIFKEKLLRNSLIIGFNMMFIYGMWASTFPIYATKSDGLGYAISDYGTLMASIAAGIILGCLVIPLIPKQIKPKFYAYLSATGLSSLTISILIFRDIYIFTAVFLFYGFTLCSWNISIISYRQTIVPTSMIGKVTGLYRTFSWGGLPIGAGLISILSDTLKINELLLFSVAISIFQFPLLFILLKNEN